MAGHEEDFIQEVVYGFYPEDKPIQIKSNP